VSKPTTTVSRPVTKEQARRILDEVSRREFLIGAAALGTLLVGCSTSDSGGTPSQGASTAGPWSFTDDRGEEISLETIPDAFAAFSTAAAALAEFGLTPGGIFGWSELEDDPQLRYVDLTNVEVLGTTWPEINLEKLAAIQPDLVATVYDSGDDSMYGFKNKNQQGQVEAIAPTVGIDGVQPLLDQIERWKELAVALGADVEADSVKQSREAFQGASDALAAAAEAKPGLRVMAVAPQTDTLYVAQVEITADLTYYESLGLEMIHPEGKGIFYWEELSWEQADKYPADVIIVDARAQEAGIMDEIAKIPTWNALPAVQAGQAEQVWHAFDPAGYRFYTEAMTELTPLIERSQVVA
jgi:iron complex transport system substrate-binding protein